LEDFYKEGVINKMINTTLCYIERDNKYLMLHRTKKENDLNEGKWIGVGGKFEKDETPEECLLREVKEETGLILTNYQLRAVITFKSNEWETEYMYLFTANEFSGELISCNEGDLEWVNKNQILDLNIWEGDRIFLEKIIKDNQFFTLKVVYEGNKLVESILKEY
jgi:8-oxo-dGTP diphosphatase